MLEPILRLGPPDRGNTKARHMKALVMTSHWSFDDTKADVPPFARNKIPARLKNNGLFSIPERTEGFLVEQKGSSGWALFFRDGAWYDVAPLPMNRVRTGTTWRPFKDQVAALSISNPVLRSWAYNTQSSRLKNFIRSFWLCMSSQQDLLHRCGLSAEASNGMLGDSFQDNVNSIVNGFTTPAMTALSGGVNITTLSQLSKVSSDWPPAGSMVVYIRLYTHQNNGNIDDCAIYTGQSTTVQYRHYTHEKAIEQHSPHYDLARRSSPQHRHMIPLIVWEPEAAASVSAWVLTMAEQTVVALFDSYHAFIRQPPVVNQDSFSIRTLYHNQYLAISAVNRQVRSKTGWSYSAPSGANAISPMFEIRFRSVIYCYPQRFSVPGQRSKTVFRMPKTFFKVMHRHKAEEGRWHLEVSLGSSLPDASRPKVGRQVFQFTIPTAVVEHFQMQPQTKGYLVFEVMDDGQPHDIPYAGCPTTGPFKDFGAANRLGIHVEWFNRASGNWLKIPLTMRINRASFKRAVQRSDMLEAIKNWRRAMDIMQLLQGIDYQGNTHGLNRSIHPSSAYVRVLTVNHLEQSVKWVPRARQSRPAPEPASFEYNARLMKEHWKESWTQLKVQEFPPPDSDFWKLNDSDSKVVGRGQPKCDLCFYMSGQMPTSSLKCERDTRYSDRYVCKTCSLLNRPCTFTPRSKARVLWGEGKPALSNASGSHLARYPTGPHRFLAFHETVGHEQQKQGLPISCPIEGLDGLELIDDAEDESGGAADDDEDSEKEDE